MISFADLHARCLELLREMPKARLRIPREKHPTSAEIFALLEDLDRKHRAQIDVLTRRLVLDWSQLRENETIWFLIQQRVRAAVFFLEHVLLTLQPEDAYLPKDSLDDTLEWAFVRLWPLAGPWWLARAARLLAARMDLSSRKSPPA